MQWASRGHAAIYKMDCTHSLKLHVTEMILKIRFGP